MADLAKLKDRYEKPVALWLIAPGGQEYMDKYRTVAENAGLPEFTEINRCVTFIKGVKDHYRKKQAAGALLREGKTLI